MLLLLRVPAAGQTAPGSEASKSEPAPHQNAKTEDPLKRDSPQSSVAGFLQACRAHDYTHACSYLDLRKLPHAARLKQGQQLAMQLEQILDRDTRFDVADLSSDPSGSHAGGLPANRERVDSFNEAGRTIDIELERVRLRSGIPIWLFSSDTIDRIPTLIRITSESPIEKRLPDPLVTRTFAGMSLWQWIALAVLVLMTAALSWFVCPVALRVTRPLFKRMAPRTNGASLEAFVGPFRLFLATVLFRLGMEWISLTTKLAIYLGRMLAFLFFAGLFLFLIGLIDLGLIRIRAILQARHHLMSYSALPLIARVIKILLFILLIAALLSEWGYNTTTILASLGVGGIAIALAAQKTIENFFGGVSVVADRPVAVGDLCKFGDRMGIVEDIGLRSTRVRTSDRTLVTVPNGQFSTMTIENFSKRDKMLFHFALNLRRDTKPNQVRDLLRSITSLLRHHDKVDAGAAPALFVGVGTYSLDLDVSAYVLTANDSEFAQIRQELLLAILDAVEASGTALALPTQASIEYSRNEHKQPNGAGGGPQEPSDTVAPGAGDQR